MAMKSNSNGQALIRQIVANVTCAICGHHFGKSDFQVVGRRGNVWAMRVDCRECRTRALLFAVVSEGATQTAYTDLTPEDWERFKDSPPISTNDVVEVHEYMQRYDGDFSEILEEPLPSEN